MGEAVAIVNPCAGRRRGAKLRFQALKTLKHLFPNLKVITTAGPGHATQLAREHQKSNLVIAVGGDGTVREVASGLVESQTELAIVPTGSGNDFIKSLAIPANIVAACHAARYGRGRRVDVARITQIPPDTPTQPVRSNIFVNAAGFGFDAAVVAETAKTKFLSGLAMYLTAVFRAVKNFVCPRVIIRTENREWEQRILLIAAANGRIYGGGMKIAPEARLDDGLLDICVIRDVSRFTVYRHLPRFVAGTHVSLTPVKMYRSRWLELELLESCPLQLDGDLQSEVEPRRYRLEIMPAALRIRT